MIHNKNLSFIYLLRFIAEKTITDFYEVTCRLYCLQSENRSLPRDFNMLVSQANPADIKIFIAWIHDPDNL